MDGGDKKERKEGLMKGDQLKVGGRLVGGKGIDAAPKHARSEAAHGGVGLEV